MNLTVSVNVSLLVHGAAPELLGLGLGSGLGSGLGVSVKEVTGCNLNSTCKQP